MVPFPKATSYSTSCAPVGRRSFARTCVVNTAVSAEEDNRYNVVPGTTVELPRVPSNAGDTQLTWPSHAPLSAFLPSSCPSLRCSDAQWHRSGTIQGLVSVDTHWDACQRQRCHTPRWQILGRMPALVGHGRHKPPLDGQQTSSSELAEQWRLRLRKSSETHLTVLGKAEQQFVDGRQQQASSGSFSLPRGARYDSVDFCATSGYA